MKMKLVLFAVIAALVFTGCGDDEGPYTCSSCNDEPEALAANDASGKGIYKGVVIGSSGTLKINIANSDATISAILTIDGDEIELTGEGSFDQGWEGYLSNDMGTPSDDSDDILIGFYVNSDGTSYEVFGAIIPGHTNVYIGVVKEYSTQLVEVFEGTFSGDDSGTFNMAVLRDDDGNGEWYAIAFSDGATEVEGVIQGGEMVGTDDDLVTIIGSIKSDNVKGSWEDDSGSSGTWKGKRTL